MAKELNWDEVTIERQLEEVRAVYQKQNPSSNVYCQGECDPEQKAYLSR